MKLLLAADFQATVSNLDLCRQAIDEIMASAQKYKPDALIFAGDLKEAYEPVSLFVVKFWIAVIREMRLSGQRVIVLLGNHDRLSQSAKAKNWMDVLRTAGAETVSKPRWKTAGDGRVAFLPYTPDRKKELAWARELAAEGNGAGDVLVFHTEVAGAKMGVLTAEGIAPEDLLGLRAHRFTVGSDIENEAYAYEAAFGGHFHLHQRVAEYPIWFIGSPFCHSWGEANEQKGHLLIEI